jgi:hypothetical protein
MTLPVAFGDRIKEPVPNGVNGPAEAKVRIIVDELASFFRTVFSLRPRYLNNSTMNSEHSFTSWGAVYKSLYQCHQSTLYSSILKVGIYDSITARVTLSAEIFFYPEKSSLASIAAASKDDAGDVAPARALSSFILLTNLAV